MVVGGSDKAAGLADGPSRSPMRRAQKEGDSRPPLALQPGLPPPLEKKEGVL